MNPASRFLRPRVIVGALLAAAALVAGGLAAPLALSGPALVSVSPADGEQRFNPQQPIRLEFSQPVRPESVQQAVSLDPPASLTVEMAAPNVALLRTGGLVYGAPYRLTVGAGVTNVLGRGMAAPATLAFATTPYNQIVAVAPSNNAAEVPLVAPLTVEFAQPVVTLEQVAAAAEDPRVADALPQPLALAPEGREPIAGVGRWLSPTLFGFYPAEPLASATSYAATLSAELSADGAARLERPQSWRFDTAAPLLEAARPFDGAEDVAADAAIELRLHKDVDPDSAAKAFSLVEVGSGRRVMGVVEASEGGIRFRPDVPLERGQTYEARLDAGVQNRFGRELGNQALTWQFRTIGNPTIVQVEPPPDATDVPVSAERVSVRFSQPIVAVTDIAGQAGLPTPLAIDPPLAAVGQWVDTSTFVLSPTAGLDPSTSYTVRVAAGLADQTGGALQQEYVWAFSTAQPQVLDASPSSDYAAPASSIRLTFDQPMDPASLASAFALVRADTAARVDGALTVDGATLVFTPTAALERGVQYDITVQGGARSANRRGALQGAFASSFRAAPLPALVESAPESGTQDADGGGSMILTFSTPMDWGSVWRNLTIDPPVTDVFTSTNEADLYLYLSLAPETDYRVTVGAAATDPYGVALGQDAAVSFRTAPLAPSLFTVGAYRSGAYDANVPVRVPFQHVNVPELSYRLARIDPEEGAQLISSYDDWRDFQPDPAAVLAEQRVPLSGERNVGRIDLAELGSLEPGVYYIELEGRDAAGPLFDVADRQVMVVSPYALTVKRSPGRLFVWAVDLKTGQPVADLPLVAGWFDYDTGALNRPTQIGRTGQDGVLDVPFDTPSPYATIYLWSADGGPLAFTTTDWGAGISPYDFSLPGDLARSELAGSIATDRPIYRPGQSVHIRGALRQSDDGRYSLPPAGSQAQIVVTDAQGSTVLSTTLALSGFGTFNTSLPIAAGAPLGIYSVSAYVREARPSTSPQFDPGSPSIYGQFSVAEYRKPALEVTVAPAAADLVQGDQLGVDVQAAYFTGGGPANAPVRWRVLSAPTFYASEAAPSFSFGRYDDADLWYRWDGRPEQGEFGELVAEGEGVTDAQGRLRLSLAPGQYTVPKGEGAARTLTIDVEVTDVDGQVIAGQGSVSLHPAEYYVGVRPEGYVARAGQPLDVSLVALTPQGDPAPSRALSVEIFRREWYSVREQGADGRLYWTSSFTDTLVDAQSATSDAQGRASVSLSVPEGGEYRVAATGKDSQGRAAVSDGFVWATGADDTFWGVDDTSRVDLIADKRSYRPGEIASVLVTAPYKGMTALVTIERGSVLQHRQLTIQGTTELLQVPIEPGYAPNVYVGVTLIAPAGDGSSPDAPAAPDMRVGLVSLGVSPEQQQLNITVTPDTTAAGPRDTVTYTVKATDYAGNGVQAEVALALVDKAVLTLADDQNPTLSEAFYGRRPLNVFTSSPLTVLVDRVTVKLQPGDKGGGGAEDEGGGVRRDFPDTAFWEPALVTGADGTASFSVTLPDSLTTWRLSARALTAATQVGEATSDIVSAKPLFLRPTLPRFLTAGDSATIQTVVNNSTAQPIDASVSIEIGAPLQLSGAPEQRVSVPAGGTALVRWDVAAPLDGRADSASLTIRASGGGVDDAIAVDLPLRRLATMETVASAGQVLDQVVETVRLPAEKLAGGGQLDVQLVPSLTAGVLQSVTAQAAQPYDGAEQSVSRFLAAAALQRALNDAGVREPKLSAALAEQLPRALQRLYAIQQLDGGWGWWEQSQSDPWITAYVIQGMLEARRAGYDVDQVTLDRAVAFLAAYDDEGGGETPSSPADMQAYKLFVLGEAGSLDRAWAATLFDRRANIGMGVEGRAYLLMVLAEAQAQQPVAADAARVKTLLAELMGSAILTTSEAHWEEPSIDYWSMASHTRSTAVALRALMRADPANFLIPNAVRYLMAEQDGGAWRTTQESAFAAQALADYVAVSGDLEASYTYRVALDGAELAQAAVGRDTLGQATSLTAPLTDLKADGSQLLLQRQAAEGQNGRGRLYYTLRLRSYEDAAAAQPLDRGVVVERQYIAVASGTLTPTGQIVREAAVGDVVQVRLTLRVPQTMRYLTVEDFLPAGLEPLDSSLKTVSAAAQDASLEEASGAYPYWWFWERTELRDDRVALFASSLPSGAYTYTYLARAVTPGVFRAMPATAYQTYAPEVFGRSAGSQFTVTRP